MKLYLVRHAEPLPKEIDPDCPLSEKGLNDIERVGAFLKVHKTIATRCIFHSGKTRAQQTAQVLAKYVNSLEGVKPTEGLKPLDNPTDWFKRLAETNEDLMLVGHLPFMDKLSSLLLCHDENKKIITFQSASVLCLERIEGNWSVCWMIVPQIVS